MNNKRYAVALATVAMVGMSTPAVAATIGNLSGQSCGTGTGTWHFVNNQTGGAAAGTFSAEFSDGSVYTGVAPSKVTASTQHFYVSAGGTLLSASTNLPGKLVLSDFTCDTVKK
jgi:hypothetical protein